MITKRLNIRRCIHTIISMLLLQLLVQACWYFNTYIQELIPTTLREARVFRTHLSLRFVIRRRPTPSTSPTRYSRTITHEISFNIEWPLLISPAYSYTHCGTAQDTRHKTHIIVFLNRLIWIQNQPYPDNTFNMIFMGYIQLQYLTTCYSVIRCRELQEERKIPVRAALAIQSVIDPSFWLSTGIVTKREWLTTRTYICEVKFSSHESKVDLPSVRCPPLGCYPLTGGKGLTCHHHNTCP